ncbi:MAG: hypothetical protein ABII12_12870, partial [Planctomycetota bacterium]
SPSSTTIFQIGFDVADPGLLYIAANALDDLDPEWTGFIRTQFSGGAHTFDLSGGRPSTQAARGVAVNGNDVYFTNGNGLYHYPIDTGISTTVLSTTTRHVEFYAGDLYVSTSSGSGPYVAGQGIYRIDDPLGTPVATQIISMPGAQPLEFAFADAETVYVACVTGGDPVVFEGIHKFKYELGAWVSKGNYGLLLGTWGRGLDLVVDGNDVTLYSVTSLPDTVSVHKIGDKLDVTSTWPNGVPTEIVPEATRGRAIAVVPGVSLTCQTCGGDFDGDNDVDGDDAANYMDEFVDALLGVAPLACADVNEDTFVNGLDIQEFITLVLANGGSGTPCSGGTVGTEIAACTLSGGSATCPAAWCQYVITDDVVPGETNCVPADLNAWENICIPCLPGDTACDEGDGEGKVIFHWIDASLGKDCYFVGQWVYSNPACDPGCVGTWYYANAE